tara:strand:- start:7845 stop:8729 length:885 start_codon:yes stop_codon:yes gene_type:complete
MIELSNVEHNIFRQSFAGDTANSAIYLSRLGAKSSYITSVGKDFLSKKMLNFLNEEKVQTHNIFQSKDKTLGLYLIQNNKKGERSFFYWRSNSAAKTLLENVNSKNLFNQISKYDAIYFSGITLSIYDQKNNKKFYKVLKSLKENSIKIYFDFNVRINNWKNKKIAQQTILKFSRISDIIFMTNEDLNNLGIRNYKYIIKKNFRNKIVVFRLGNGEVEVYNKSNIEKYKFYLNKKVKDTTGCGDAFNACFLFNYFNNKEIKQCIKRAHRLGKTVANFKGAIIPKENFNSKFYAN